MMKYIIAICENSEWIEISSQFSVKTGEWIIAVKIVELLDPIDYTYKTDKERTLTVCN